MCAAWNLEYYVGVIIKIIITTLKCKIKTPNKIYDLQRERDRERRREGGNDRGRTLYGLCLFFCAGVTL